MRKIICVLILVMLVSIPGRAWSTIIVDMDFPIQAETQPDTLKDLSSISIAFNSKNLTLGIRRFIGDQFIGYRFSERTNKWIPIFETRHLNVVEINYCLGFLFIGIFYPFSWSKDLQEIRQSFGYQSSLVAHPNPDQVIKVTYRAINLNSLKFNELSFGFGISF